MRFVSWMVCCLLLLGAPLARAAADGPSQVKIDKAQGGYRLRVDGKPFFIKGGGGREHLDELAARGGNAVRTWSVEEDPLKMRAFLDEAQRLGLKVAVGIAVGNERHGFNYDDEAAVAAQLQRIRGEVEAWKDHPAVLMWVAGNELNLHYENQKVWNAVGQIADMIHQVDPNHPVMTTLAGFDKPLIEQIKQRASSPRPDRHPAVRQPGGYAEEAARQSLDRPVCSDRMGSDRALGIAADKLGRADRRRRLAQGGRLAGTLPALYRRRAQTGPGLVRVPVGAEAGTHADVVRPVHAGRAGDAERGCDAVRLDWQVATGSGAGDFACSGG